MKVNNFYFPVFTKEFLNPTKKKLVSPQDRICSFILLMELETLWGIIVCSKEEWICCFSVINPVMRKTRLKDKLWSLIKSSNMHNSLHVLFLLAFLIPSIHSQADASFYINFAYGTETTVEPFSEDYRQIKLPCTSRILSCSYEFSLLPPGWIGNSDKILVPIEDALNVGNYAVELTAS